MSQRAMICNRKEQKQAWRVRKRLERSGYWCEGNLCGRSTAHRVLEAGSDSSPSPFGNAVGPRRSWERELGSRALLGLQRRVRVSWFCCSTFAGGICVKKSLSSPKTVANAYAAIIYFILHIALAGVKTVPKGKSDLFAANPLLQLFTMMGLKHREQQPLLLQPGAHGHATSTCTTSSATMVSRMVLPG